MKTATQKSFVLISLIVLLVFGVSTNSFATSADEHEALATQFENLAKEMQAKVEEQKDIVNHKPRTSYLGRNGHKIKKHIAFKIRKYEKAASEYLEQAAHHHAMAVEQPGLKSVTNQNQTNYSSFKKQI
ncbi:MAG: hypothetical protein DHS20C10_14550 [marine bacterium B5-7]|nr:MAG: hypothetical protein DHS20C10_14550 [marine bacterium B5-7]